MTERLGAARSSRDARRSAAARCPRSSCPPRGWSVGDDDAAARALDAALRAGDPPVIGRLVDDRLFLDCRTVLPGQVAGLVRARHARRGAHERRPHVVVGTAGHIDHGKTSLVKALTGIDTDRLPEEKARGITIDLGFAFLEEPDGLTIEIVDVPGHERFVKNMLAGVGGIDLAMLVIAADEGVMPQTREHFAICSLLHIQSGLVALTKTDMVEPDWLELVRDDVAGLVRGTFLDGAPDRAGVVEDGRGARRSARGAARPGRSRCRRGAPISFRGLPIDRVFTIKGFGTVVTGTLMAGQTARRRSGRGVSARRCRPRCAGCRPTASR